ncbi:HD domain-containing phosphohydrolase [Deinococcus sp.]|uniref:HD domain-containing phosphohydrolase n=1 Tax=Deinococcus sp. TaxID=47478 RepID=UPI0025FFE664|nr:HD domain-containing phosphohydrolase [Deinococcus sp.]
MTALAGEVPHSFSAALEGVRRSALAARAANDPDALRCALRREGELLLLDGQPNAALNAFLEAASLCPAAELSEQARLWQQAAHAQAILFSPVQAQEHLGTALSLMRQAGDAPGIIDILEDLADSHARQGDLGWALEHLETNLSLRRELGDQAGLCRTLLAVGRLRLRQPVPVVRLARHNLEEAVGMARELADASLNAQAQGWLAHACALGGDAELAASLFEQSYQGLERLSDLNLMAQVRLGQARLAAAQGVGARTQSAQVQSAQVQSAQAQSAQVQPEPLQLAQLQSAQELARQALGLSRRSASPYTEVPALQLLSSLAEAAGDLRAALDYHHAYHDLSVTLGRAQSLARAQEVSARLDLEGSRQETELQRARGSRLERRVAERTAQLEATQAEMTLLLASAAECRDAPQGLHAFWVGEASACVARQLGWEQARAHDLGLAARLHDIGKLAIPDAVLLKKGALDEAEWTLMRTHTTLGARLLDHSTSPLLKLAAEVALSHHERWDGSGYPAGALGAQASQAGRIVAVVDAFDALLSTRSYKAAWSLEAATDYLHQHSGTLFDAEVVGAVVALQAQGGLPPRERPGT